MIQHSINFINMNINLSYMIKKLTVSIPLETVLIIPIAYVIFPQGTVLMIPTAYVIFSLRMVLMIPSTYSICNISPGNGSNDT